jgi:hypothetical protein
MVGSTVAGTGNFLIQFPKLQLQESARWKVSTELHENECDKFREALDAW